MNDEPISPLGNAIRNTIMRVVLVFFPTFPRKLTRKYKKLGFSPQNLVDYIEEYKAYMHEKFPSDGHPHTYSPAYHLLQEAVRDYQSDELRFTSAPDEVHLVRNGEVTIRGSDMYAQQARAKGDNRFHGHVDRQYIAWCRRDMPGVIEDDPVLKHWMSVVKDTSKELIVVIGPERA